MTDEELTKADNQKRKYAPRYIPIITGLVWLLASFGLLVLWRAATYSFWWWVRGIIFSFITYEGVSSLRFGFFASAREVWRSIGKEDQP
jgi:hypothetical protein